MSNRLIAKTIYLTPKTIEDLNARCAAEKTEYGILIERYINEGLNKPAQNNEADGKKLLFEGLLLIMKALQTADNKLDIYNYEESSKLKGLIDKLKELS